MTERLTAAQRRHLTEMLGPDGESLYWRPRGAGEARVASNLHIAGLILPAGFSWASGYYLSPKGQCLAAELMPDVAPTSVSDSDALGGSRHGVES